MPDTKLSLPGEIDSYLGENPSCDKCGKYIHAGDEVRQTFTGKVIAGDYGELGIAEYTYALVHQVCETM